MSRAQVRSEKVSGIVESSAETEYNTPDRTESVCVHIDRQSSTDGGTNDAAHQAALPNHPTSILVRLNCRSTNSTVPEMTAVSKPKRNPPRVATKQIHARKRRLPSSGIHVPEQYVKDLA